MVVQGIGVFAYGEDTHSLRLTSELDALYRTFNAMLANEAYVKLI